MQQHRDSAPQDLCDAANHAAFIASLCYFDDVEEDEQQYVDYVDLPLQPGNAILFQ